MENAVAIGFLVIAVMQLGVLLLMAGGVWAFYTRFVLAPKASKEADILRVADVLKNNRPKAPPEEEPITGIFRQVRDLDGKVRMLPIDEAEDVESIREERERKQLEDYADLYISGKISTFPRVGDGD